MFAEDQLEAANRFDWFSASLGARQMSTLLACAAAPDVWNQTLEIDSVITASTFSSRSDSIAKYRIVANGPKSLNHDGIS
jgi:hypothetical protein